MAFAARGNDIYYADNMTIYHLAFDDDKEDDTNEAGDPVSAEEWMVDVSALDKNAGLQYNGLGVHPVTGRVYINTLKSFANYGQNQIWGFDFGTSTEAPAVKYENYTSFPAGFFSRRKTDFKTLKTKHGNELQMDQSSFYPVCGNGSGRMLVGQRR